MPCFGFYRILSIGGEWYNESASYVAFAVSFIRTTNYIHFVCKKEKPIKNLLQSHITRFNRIYFTKTKIFQFEVN